MLGRKLSCAFGGFAVVVSLAASTAHAQIVVVSRQYQGTANANAVDKFCGSLPDSGSDSFNLTPAGNDEATDVVFAEAITKDCFGGFFESTGIGTFLASPIGPASFVVDSSVTATTTPPVAQFDPICSARATINTTTIFSLTESKRLWLRGAIKANNFSPNPEPGYENFAEIELVYIPSNTRFFLLSGTGLFGVDVFEFNLDNGVPLPVGEYRLTTKLIAAATNAGSTWNNSDAYIDLEVTTNACNDIDFNNDGVFPDNQDIFDFVFVFGGGDCPNKGSCDPTDFNNDGVFPDTQDIFDFVFVFSGGACPVQ